MGATGFRTSEFISTRATSAPSADPSELRLAKGGEYLFAQKDQDSTALVWTSSDPIQALLLTVVSLSQQPSNDLRGSLVLKQPDVGGDFVGDGTAAEVFSFAVASPELINLIDLQYSDFIFSWSAEIAAAKRHSREASAAKGLGECGLRVALGSSLKVGALLRETLSQDLQESLPAYLQTLDTLRATG